MNMQLFRACSVHLFGRSAHKRLFALFFVTSFIGSFIGIMIGKSVDAPPQSFNRLSVSFVFTGQIIVLALCLPLAISKLSDTLLMLSRVIPFTQYQAYFIRAFPMFVSFSLGFCGLAWPIASIGTALGLSSFVVLAMILLGSISGWGVVYAVLWLPKYISLASLVVYVGVEFMLVRSINQALMPIPFIVPFCFLIGLAIILVGFFAKMPVHASWHKHVQRVTIQWASQLWGIAKVLRHQRTKVGFITVVVASIIVTIFAWQAQALQTGFIGPVVTLLAASFACDLRPLARLTRPFEIVGLRGSTRFVSTVALGGFTACLIGLLPLIGTFILAVPPPQEILLVFSFLTLGYAMGLWVSFWLVPRARDPLSQVVAVSVAGAILFALSKLPFIAAMGTTNKASIYYCLAILAVLHCGNIEYKRNKFSWR